MREIFRSKSLLKRIIITRLNNDKNNLSKKISIFILIFHFIFNFMITQNNIFPFFLKKFFGEKNKFKLNTLIFNRKVLLCFSQF